MESSFQIWVDKYGSEQLCADLHITHHTLKNWLMRRGWPKVLFIQEIIRLSKGEMTFEKIIESTKPRGGAGLAVKRERNKINRKTKRS